MLNLDTHLLSIFNLFYDGIGIKNINGDFEQLFFAIHREVTRKCIKDILFLKRNERE